MSQAVRPVERTTLGEDTRGARMIGVARLTGVSHQTVSRALNAHPQGASADSRTSRLGDRSARIQRMGAVRRLSRRTTRLARAGARFVDDIAPFEQRKLWLLNGGHSLLAYAGSARGHETIAEAVTDPECRAWLQDWWVEASRHLTLPVGGGRGLPGRAARSVRQPPNQASARPDRGRRLPEAARADPAHRATGTRPG